jgi:hypothetical protein
MNQLRQYVVALVYGIAPDGEDLFDVRCEQRLAKYGLADHAGRAEEDHSHSGISALSSFIASKVSRHSVVERARSRWSELRLM